MLKRIFLSIILAQMTLMVPMLSQAKSENPWEIKLPFKAATIPYVLSGMEKGTETLYIVDYGQRTAKYHKGTMNVMGMASANETIEFIDPEWIYSFDLVEKTGTKAANPQKYMIEEYNKLTRQEKKQVRKNCEEIAAVSMMMGMNAEVEKNARKIHGYECDKMAMLGSTVYVLPDTGIALLSESNMMGMKIKIEATAIKKGNPPKNVFEHPKGITPVIAPEADAMARSMAKETIGMLKDPDGAEKISNNPPMMQSREQHMSPEEQQQMEQAMDALKNIFNN